MTKTATATQYTAKSEHTPSNWKIEDNNRFFSGDEVIEAYFKGKNDGLEAMQKLRLNQLSSNLVKSGVCTGIAFKELKKRNFTPLSAHLKISSFDVMNIIIVVSEEDFLNDKFLNIYSFIGNLEGQHNDDLFRINFSFLDGDINFNSDRLKADGYQLEFSKKKK